MRLAVYTDYLYRRDDTGVYAERAFALFLARLAEEVDELVLLGRVHPEPGRSHYRLPDRVRFVALPHYESMDRPGQAVGAMARSLLTFGRQLGPVDAVWLLGPHPLGVAFAAVAALRNRRIILGVRQDMPVYARTRHPGRRWVHMAAAVLEGIWRTLARRCPIVVVGPGLAANYPRARHLLMLTVSLVREGDIAGPEVVAAREAHTQLRALSVGRLETEKNPLLLADVLARVRAVDPRWRLVVAGEGPLAAALASRLAELGVADAAELRGYVPIDGGLHDLYRECDAFLHISWTEGLPQVLFEAFAARLPVVATAVGGVEAAVGDAALLIPPGDAAAAAEALIGVAGDAELRGRLIEAGVARVTSQTLDEEARRTAAFLRTGVTGSGPVAGDARRARP